MSSWLSGHLASDVLEDWHDRREAETLARVKWLGGLTNSTAVGALAAKMTGEKPPQTLTYEQHVDIEMARIQGRKQAELEARRRRLCPTIEEQMQDALEDGKRQAAERRRAAQAAPPTPTPATDALVEPMQRSTEQPDLTVAQVEPNPAPVSTAQTAAPAGPVQAASANVPEPLITSDIAHCFASLHWDEQGWKKPLGYPPKWLRSCIAIPGKRGVHETRWNPVLIGAALVQSGHAKPNSVRARFQSKPRLSAWLEAWKTYEADYLDTE